MERHRKVLGVALIALVLALVTPIVANAQGYGCWICEVGTSGGITGPNDEECEQVGNEEEGDGIFCTEYWTVIGTACYIEPEPCFNVNAPGEAPPEEESQG